MSATSTPAPPAHRAAGGDRFYLAMAIATIIVIVAGFAPTYYLRPLFDRPPLPAMVVWHGVMMTAWLLLFVLQAALVTGGRVALHRRLGVAGSVLAALIAVSAFETMIFGGRHGFVGRGYPASPLSFMSIGFFDVLVFAVLTGLALHFRRTPATHKRLMLLAMVALWPPGVSRLPIVPDGVPPGLFAAIAVSGVVLACAAYDAVRSRRLHPVYLWAGSLFIVSLPLRFVIGTTGAWIAFAEWMLRVFP